MRYLVTRVNAITPFLTDIYDYENHWIDNIGMVIYDLKTLTHTLDGKTWHPIETDHL